MQDRFKFRAVLHQNKYEEYQLEKFSHQRVFDVMSINLGIEYSTIEIIAEYPNGDWAVREIDDKDIDLIQCTGLKDKNGKLIYEGDIVSVKVKIQDSLYEDEYYFQNYKGGIIFEKGIIAIDVIDTTKHPISLYYHAKDCEVVGNIYENPKLLKE